MKLWLDDKRSPPDKSWFWAKDYMAALPFLMLDQLEEVSLDHDLGEGKSGYDFAKRIEELAAAGRWDRVPRIIYIHSANPVGRKNILAAIDSIERMRNA